MGHEDAGWGLAPGSAWGWAPCVWTGWYGRGRCRAVQWLASGEAHTWPSFKQQPRKSLTRASAPAPRPRPPSLLTRSCFSSQDLIKVHHSFLRAIDVSMMAGGSSLAKVFLDFKER